MKAPFHYLPANEEANLNDDLAEFARKIGISYQWPEKPPNQKIRLDAIMKVSSPATTDEHHKPKGDRFQQCGYTEAEDKA